MSNDSQQIVSKAWNFAHVLRDDGLSYMAYTEQITFLLFLKMADEMTKPPYNRPPIVPAKHGWQTLLKYEGDELEVHYRHTLEELGKQPGMLGEIFKKARPDIQNPATLLDATKVRIERIVSHSHASPEGFWYEQDQHEWVVVLKGAARLRFEGDDQPVEMKSGDFVNIPAHKKHRVEWTTPDEPTIWLAVFYE